MKLALLGCGNMAQALLGLAPLDQFGIDLLAYDPVSERAIEFAGKGAVFQLGDLKKCDLYLIACKPQQFEALAIELKKVLPLRATIISIMAGVSTGQIHRLLGNSNIVRVMPNTPALVGEGVNAVYFTPNVDSKIVETIEKLLSSVSELFVFPSEEMIDIITGFSGSGPAYIFELARIMIDKLISMGVTARSANSMIKQTIYGAAKLMLESPNSPEDLREMVTSKKGVTYEALEVFKQKDLEGIFSCALDAAYKRAKELSIN